MNEDMLKVIELCPEKDRVGLIIDLNDKKIFELILKGIFVLACLGIILYKL